MNAETGGSSGESLSAKVQQAERQLHEAARAAGAAEQRAEAEIKALETDLERQRAEAEAELERLRLTHEEDLQRAREAKEQAIEAAEARLGEIERQADAAEQRIEAAERRAAESERTVADERVRAREAAAAWLRDQLDSIRREAEAR